MTYIYAYMLAALNLLICPQNISDAKAGTDMTQNIKKSFNIAKHSFSPRPIIKTLIEPVNEMQLPKHSIVGGQ